MAKRNGFSILEILVVIGILGLMAGLLLPAMGMVQAQAERSLTAQKLRQLGLVLREMESSGAIGSLNEARTLKEWVRLVAAEGEVNERSYFLFPEDVRKSEHGDVSLEHPVVDREGRLIWPLENRPLSFTVVCPIRMRGDGRVPVLWSRGLKPDGNWEGEEDASPGVYGEAGGFVLFSDGRVQFYQTLDQDGGLLRDFKSGLPTPDWRKAIRPRSRILRSE